MRQRGHPVEQMRRVTRAGVEGGNGDVEIRAGMSERHAVTLGAQPPHQIESALELGCHGHDSDVGATTGDDVENLAPRERGVGARRKRCRTHVEIGRYAQALERLRPSVLGIEEVAFDVCGQHASGLRTPREPRAPHAVEKSTQCRGVAGDGRGTERRDAKRRHAAGDLDERIRPIEAVEPANAVDVHVDEAGRDVATADVDDLCPLRRASRLRLDGGDARAVEHESAWRDAIGQDQIPTRHQNHRSAAPWVKRQSTCTCTL
jgi:hypothetical protein